MTRCHSGLGLVWATTGLALQAKLVGEILPMGLSMILKETVGTTDSSCAGLGAKQRQSRCDRVAYVVVVQSHWFPGYDVEYCPLSAESST